MKTQALMSLSALFLAILGAAGLFLPQELLARFGVPEASLVILVQAAGAAYLGFAILNWMARSVLIGGIYARPVALGNFAHFAIVAITLAKAMIRGPRGIEPGAALAVYAVFAAWFGLVLFTSPTSAVQARGRDKSSAQG